MKPCRAGFVLLTVLIVVMVSAMTAVSLLFAIRADATAQAATAQGEQAWAAVMSGIQRAISVAESSVQGAAAWEENPEAFRHQEVADDGANRWYFTIWSASADDTSAVRFGLSDEASRLNVRTADPQWLAALPGWTVDPDPGADPGSDLTGLPTETSEGDVTNASTNAPTGGLTSARSVASALREAGLSPAALRGEDANYNLRLEPNEDDGDESLPGDNRDGVLDAGLQRFLTDLSYEPNTNPQGELRVDVSAPGVSLASLGLPSATQDYLAAMRTAGQSLNHVADLLEARMTVPNERGENVELESGVGAGEIVTLLAECTTRPDPRLPGLLNLNTAPPEALAVLPGLDETLAESIVSTRRVLGAEEKASPAWVYTRGLVSAEQFRQIAPQVTTRAFQFRFHCLGYGLPGGHYRVVEAVIDVAEQPARLVSVRDLSRHGFPLPLDEVETDSAQARLKFGNRATASAANAQLFAGRW
ncbi:MAG: hypothetical protein H7A45_14555 [Verrucomicrobiales bacterium]|nr:hypothetical protein [Verrucomicrobiales bacterium]MCP5526401.1 hypothetical protein [Verrucomicrobiales bacterium]